MLLVLVLVLGGGNGKAGEEVSATESDHVVVLVVVAVAEFCWMLLILLRVNSAMLWGERCRWCYQRRQTQDAEGLPKERTMSSGGRPTAASLAKRVKKRAIAVNVVVVVVVVESVIVKSMAAWGGSFKYDGNSKSATQAGCGMLRERATREREREAYSNGGAGLVDRWRSITNRLSDMKREVGEVSGGVGGGISREWR
jgi:hypothetical protein